MHVLQHSWWRSALELDKKNSKLTVDALIATFLIELGFFNCFKDSSGAWRYDGHHTKGAEDGKWVTYKDYNYNFNGIPLQMLRIAPNAMDALMACKEAFSWNFFNISCFLNISTEIGTVLIIKATSCQLLFEYFAWSPSRLSFEMSRDALPPPPSYLSSLSNKEDERCVTIQRRREALFAPAGITTPRL